MFIHDEIFTMAEPFRLARLTLRDTKDQICKFAAGLRQGDFAGQDATGIEVHVFLHCAKGGAVAGDFDERRNGTADDAAATGDEQHDLRAGADQIHDAFRVVWICVAELHEMFVRHAVENPKARPARLLGNANHSLNQACAALGECAETLFLNCRQSAGKIAR